MPNSEHYQIIEQGVDAWNKWRKSNSSVIPDLSYAELSFKNLLSMNFQGVNLKGANLVSAELDDSDFSRADLSDADLSNASLARAKLSGANLTNAFLFMANLAEADLSAATLTGATLQGAILIKANLGGADLREASLQKSILIDADLNNANLSGAKLYHANAVRAGFENAILTGCFIYGISAWEVNLNNAVQLGIVITRPGEPVITVDNLEVAQFIYLLLNHENLRNVLNSILKNGVLILGRFGGGGLEVLKSIAAKLREMKYLPFIFDFDRPMDRNYTETIKTLVGLSRFVIVDLSGPSVAQELYATVPHFKIPFVPIMERGRNTYSMFRDILEYPWVLKPVIEFETQEQLMGILQAKVIIPAEEMHKQRQIVLQELYPY